LGEVDVQAQIVDVQAQIDKVDAQIDNVKNDLKESKAKLEKAESAMPPDEASVTFWRGRIKGLDEDLKGLYEVLKGLHEVLKGLYEDLKGLRADRSKVLDLLSKPDKVVKKRKLEEVFVMKKQNMKKVSKEFDDEDEMFSYFETLVLPPMITRNLSHRYIFIRECYNTLYAHVLTFLGNSSPGTNLIISGNPGIGKSYFYLYCAIQLINDRFFATTNKILLLNSQNRYWKFDGVSFVEFQYDDQISYDPNIIRLIDGSSDNLVGWSALSILFTSPKGENNPNFKSFFKNSSVSYMPVWELSELKNANALLKLINVEVSDSDLKERFELVGGVARYVLNSTKSIERLEAELKQAVAESDALKIIEFVKAATPVSDSSSWLLKIVPTGRAWGALNLDFQTNAVAERIMETSAKQSVADLKKFAMENILDPNSATFRGKIYEALFHRMLKLNRLGGKKKKARALSPNVEDINIQFDKCQTQQFIELEEIVKDDAPKYYYPKSKTYASVDGIYVTSDEAYLFQATIMSEHPIRNAPLKDIVNSMMATLSMPREKIFLVFVVPKNKFDEGWTSEQNLVTSGRNPQPISRGKVSISQYVIPIDWSEL